MVPETVNAHGVKQTKLSKLQKLILTEMYEDANESEEIRVKQGGSEYPGSRWTVWSSTLAWRVAMKCERKSYVSKEEAEFNKPRDDSMFENLPAEFKEFRDYSWGLASRRRFQRRLLPSFRASMSRSLKRLEARGLITTSTLIGRHFTLKLTTEGLAVVKQTKA